MIEAAFDVLPGVKWQDAIDAAMQKERELIKHYWDLRGELLFNINCTSRKTGMKLFTAEEYAKKNTVVPKD